MSYKKLLSVTLCALMIINPLVASQITSQAPAEIAGQNAGEAANKDSGETRLLNIMANPETGIAAYSVNL